MCVVTSPAADRTAEYPTWGEQFARASGAGGVPMLSFAPMTTALPIRSIDE
jgi:hypothetical protein